MRTGFGFDEESLAIATRGNGNDLGPISSTTTDNSLTGQIKQTNPVAKRALTQNEINFLRSTAKEGATPALRVIGALNGVSAAVLVTPAATAQPVDPAAYTLLGVPTG